MVLLVALTVDRPPRFRLLTTSAPAPIWRARIDKARGRAADARRRHRCAAATAPWWRPVACASSVRASVASTITGVRLVHLGRRLPIEAVVVLLSAEHRQRCVTATMPPLPAKRAGGGLGSAEARAPSGRRRRDFPRVRRRRLGC